MLCTDKTAFLLCFLIDEHDFTNYILLLMNPEWLLHFRKIVI